MLVITHSLSVLDFKVFINVFIGNVSTTFVCLLDLYAINK